ncbi:universal stress protein [Sinanaerobacter chloroacetimidivorans]|uniref:Universal stress protein n=1 Tax=Sinanaerobacter chloroacetimidivorans TaxID=2818044 RepID=A0A8J8AZR8_9FIRM|nr:universal stress protein [Sinanaerobacter chloroacetimidivorans]MBR0596813.1 universal stress protein [Sinanaerobacter chloroacetimidivorans]
MKKILVPIDGSKYSELAMEKAKEIAFGLDSQVTLIHVNDFSQHMFHYNREVEENFKTQFEQMSMDILEDGKKKFEPMTDRVITVQLEGNVANKIIEYANGNDFDLVIIGAKGKSRLQSFLVGSSAYKVALYVNKPVLIAR